MYRPCVGLTALCRVRCEYTKFGSYFPFPHFQYGCFGQFQRYCFHTRRGPPSFAFCVASLFVRRLAIAIAACWPRRPWASHTPDTTPIVAMPRDGADDKKSPSAVDSEGFTPVGKGGKPLKPDGGGKDITAAAGAGGGAGLAGSPQADAAGGAGKSAGGPGSLFVRRLAPGPPTQ